LTPQERARAIIEEIDQAFYGERERIISAAIVDAINEALERAALIAQDLTDPVMHAENIRALKHQEST